METLMTLRRESDPRRLPSPVPKSPQITHKKTSKLKDRETIKHADAAEIQASLSNMERRSSRDSNKSRYSDAEEIPGSPARKSSRDSNIDQTEQDESASVWIPNSLWQCKHCTFINPAGNRICQVCCKTATAEETTLMSSRPASASSRKQSLESSEISSSSPEKRMEEEQNDRKDTQDMAVLNSALDEAEKEISRGLEELMKLKEEFTPVKSKEKEHQSSTSKPPSVPESSSSKPVYKSTGKMRTSILDKIIPPNKVSTASTSTSTETQTGPNSKSDRILEARRPSTSSTTSDAYNSPIAQSPQLERMEMSSNRQSGAISKSGIRKDSSCQTQTDDLMDFYERKKAEEEALLANSGFGYRYGDRMDMVNSPTQGMFDRGYGMMQRSHSRASLFTGRLNDFSPMDYGFGQRPMYRSVSRSSLTGDYPEGRLSEFHNLRKPDYYLSMEELVERRRQDSIRAQGLELVRMIREAEQQGFTADDIQVALTNCGKQNPLEWLQENWKIMVENVINLSTSYANDKKENDIGTISENEAREALRLHKGHIWASVTECVETRQRKLRDSSIK
ncbi:e3 ubiquitin-protein ligase RNF31 [Trichonephila clavipes]|nr:e3 ubiquitin-protein ligase RNF31 [Trichonephila clavipes]